MTKSKFVLYSGEDEWSALYVDGVLDIADDHDYVYRRIAELLGVEERYGNAFLMGGNYQDDVAQTVAEAEAYAAKEDDREQQLRETEARIKLLEAEAASLRASL